LPIDCARGAKSGAIAAVGIRNPAFERYIEDDFLGNTVKRQIADEPIVICLVCQLHTPALESHRGVLLDVEEIGRLEMGVAVALSVGLMPLSSRFLVPEPR